MLDDFQIASGIREAVCKQVFDRLFKVAANRGSETGQSHPSGNLFAVDVQLMKLFALSDRSPAFRVFDFGECSSNRFCIESGHLISLGLIGFYRCDFQEQPVCSAGPFGGDRHYEFELHLCKFGGNNNPN